MKKFLKKFIPPFLLSAYHWWLALAGAILYRFPSKKIKVIGVTGTNGKTTVVYLITKILEKANFRVASLSSIKFKIGDKEWPNTLKMTMPGRFKLQKFLRQALNSGCQYAILEVTSEGIKQHRHRFIDFDIAVFTNLSPEHIEAHGGFENYKKAKGKLFQVTNRVHIINVDDENARYFLKFPADKKYNYGLSRGDINQKDLQLNLRLIGDFNLYNSLAAIGVGLSQGVSLEIAKKAVEEVEEIPGRMEEVISEPFKVFVDYAFTPVALEKVYQTLTNQLIDPSIYKLICVLGACGGGRDKWKRPVLGRIAAKYCHSVILTNEDPYDEDPIKIINQVAVGSGKKAEKILDRREAIRTALRLAQPNDRVIITGKGSEPWICLKGGKKIPWDDREVAREEFKKIGRFKILEHVSDLKIKVFGRDKKELFENAMIGMFEGARYEKNSKFNPPAGRLKRKIGIKSPDLSSLLVNFLSEVLYLSEVNQEVYHKIEFDQFSDKNLKGTLFGKGLKRIGVQIKGVTYHNLEIHQKKDGSWEVIILFDI